MSENKKGKTTDTRGEFADPHTQPKRDERGRIIIHDLNQIPDNMTEDEVAEFWDTHAMSEELLDATYIPEGEDDDELPPPRSQSIVKAKSQPLEAMLENVKPPTYHKRNIE